MYDSEFLEADDGINSDNDDYDDEERKGENDFGDEIEEEPQLVTIKTLTPSSSQLESLNL